MISDWIVDQLSAICDIEYGTRVVRKKDAGTKFPVYGGGGATFSMDTYNRENRMVVARFAMSEKCTRFVKGKFFLNDSGLTLTALDKEAVNERFLNYQILSLNDEIYALGRGTAQKNLNMEAFKKITLAYPKSLSEQKQIVSILDEAFEKIEQAKANIEKNIENTKDLFQSKLNEIFSQKGDGWDEKKFSDLFKLKSGEGLTAKKMRPGPYPVYGGNGIAGHHDEFNMEGSYIVIGRVGALCGNVRHLNEKFWLTDNAFQIKEMSADFDADYLCYLLNYKKLGSYARQAAQPVVSNSSLKDVPISYPIDKSIQIKYASRIRSLEVKLDSLNESYYNKLTILDELKKSILQKAFAGELTKTVEA